QGLVILDISDPKRPEIYCKLETEGPARSVCRYKKFIFLADGNAIQSVNVKDLDVPILSTRLDLGCEVRKLYLNKKDLFVITEKDMQIYSISNPRALKRINKTEITGNFMDVFTLGDHAYLADYDKGLTIVDIHNLKKPTVVSVCKTPGNPRGVWVSGNYAYIADFENGLQLVNIKDSAEPFLAGTYETTGDAHAVYFLGKFAFIGDGRAGMRIYSSDIKDVDENGIIRTLQREGKVGKSDIGVIF
ncbi:MAG: hypothetical protein IKS95_00360, partial [Verrucomicrobia bacterium]|nr:hypothetical protein [Verrucomicrobiota bacterium]